MSRSKTSKRTLIAEERRNQAIELRKAGESYRQIAEKLGTTPSNVHKMIRKSLDQIRAQTAEHTDELRILEIERLDSLYQHAYRAVINGDVRAVDQALRCMERRAKLLGLDAPSRSEVTASLTSTNEWIELRTRILAVLERYPEARNELIRELQGELT